MQLFLILDGPLVFKGHEVVTLKQIPRRVREQQRNYQFLSTQLIKNNIPFRWLTPEGLLISWREKKFKINSIDKAGEFYRRYMRTEEEQESKEETESRSQEEITVEGKEIEREGTEQKNQEEEENNQPRRELRTRVVEYQ
uniref:Uncharacterized protein n=1 Tax=Micrurus surinamensis TaxID=129470 RepID=A0A2D4NSM7_MICSU